MAWILFIGFMVLIMLRVPIVIAMGMAVLSAVIAGGFSDTLSADGCAVRQYFAEPP